MRSTYIIGFAAAVLLVNAAPTWRRFGGGACTEEPF